MVATAAAPLPARENPGEVVAVYSSVSPAYRRSVQADGSFKPETYAFGEGGPVEGRRKDMTIDLLRFVDVAQIIARPLAAQKYLPGDPKKPASTDLLIMVYWGATIGTDDGSSSSEYALAESTIPPPLPPPPPPPDASGGAAMSVDPGVSGAADMGAQRAAAHDAAVSAQDQATALMMIANHRRDRQDVANATMLGYLTELERVRAFGTAAFAGPRRDVIDEVEESRYFVVLMAYDFPLLWKHKERKLLWETRFSIPERRHDFGKDLAGMAQGASGYFGRNSGGLRHTTLQGHVELGDLKVLDEDVGAKK
ncbi:MAG TPA: hypothetical protein VG710_03850 [Opitutus sp.]|nr:hypothetical protein [Opitutus sp.]